MEIQKALFSNKPVKPWEDVCCESCWNAEYERCTCRCGGRFHGVGNPKSKAAKGHKRAMEDQQHYKSTTAAQAYKQLITDPHCRTCGFDLTHERVLHYDHTGGWPVEGEEKLQWLWITCPKCGYQNALWKLGVPRA